MTEATNIPNGWGILKTEKLFKIMCFEGIYEPLVFLQNPETFHGSFVFGQNQILKECPKDKSRIDATLSYGISDGAIEMYNNGLLENDGVCPREILRFDPPPTVPYCKTNAYRPITRVAEFSSDFKFTNMPDWFNNVANRTERLISAFSDLNHSLNFKDGLNFSITSIHNNPNFTVSINDEHFVLPNLDMYFEMTEDSSDVKFDTASYWSHQYGFERMCSVIGANLSTFDDFVMNVTEKSEENCWLLLAADCSNQSRFSLFIKVLSDNLFAIKIYSGNDFIEYNPTENTERTMLFNGERIIKLKTMNSEETSLLPMTINYNDEDVLVLEIDYSTKIQYNLNNMLSISVTPFYKRQTCGLCGSHSEKDSNYKLCS